MSIQTELTRITNAKAAIKTAVEGKGVIVPDGTLLDGMAALIEAIEAGGGGVTCGSITPLTYIKEIEHGLGTVPRMFMWYTDFVSMTGRKMGANERVMSDEQAFNSADCNLTSYIGRLVFILVGGEVFSLDMSSNIDWGFFTKGSIENLERFTITCDETKFSCAHMDNSIITLIPYHANGNVTVHWFAIA